MDTVSHNRIDTRQLTDIIHELNISRNYVSAYPKGHPVISASSEKLAARFDRLIADRSELTFGITKNSIVIRSMRPSLDNVAFRVFAGTLFRHGIVAVTFRKGLAPDELVKFNELLLEKRDRIREKGGIEEAIQQTGIQSIDVSQVNYDSFQLVEEEILPSPPNWVVSASPWDAFVHSLLAPHSPAGTDLDRIIDPLLLAETINALYAPLSPEKAATLSESLGVFLAELGAAELSPAKQKDFFNSMGSFAGSLHPDLLQQFIQTVFATFAASQNHLPGDQTEERGHEICRALHGSEFGAASLPPLAMCLVDVLSQHAEAGPVAADGSVITDQQENRDLATKLTLLFREDRTDEFVPPKYLKTLSLIVNSDSFMECFREDREDLVGALDTAGLDVAVGEIIIEIMDSGVIDNLEKMKEALQDIFRYCLQTGDYRSLLILLDRTLTDTRSAAEGKDKPGCELLSLLEECDFVDEILNGFNTWGKDKYSDIGAIIKRVGEPFVEPLLDRLADEQSMSARRCYMTLLTELAKTAKVHAIARLGDSRWYVLRNMVIILRSSNDPDVIEHIKALLDHPHPKVRQTVLDTFMHFKSPDSGRLLLKEMKISDPAARVSAIQLAGKSSAPEVFTHLVSLLRRGRPTSRRIAEKKAAVGALADMGACGALPVLGAILGKKVYLFRSNHLQLQMEIVNSLDRYPDNAGIELLTGAATSADVLLSRAAVEKLRASRENEA